LIRIFKGETLKREAISIYTCEDYKKLTDKLVSVADDKHRKFHSKLVPNVSKDTEILGIPIPKIREIAKELLRDCDDIDGYFRTCLVSI